MKIILFIVSILLITIVLLQAGKAESATAITGGNDDLFKNRKERGVEVFITRTTFILGAIFFVICLIMGF
ncbi:MAG: preprotein translocase subunit SecG [Bacilli bacterium]|nr:preprotein translocase subunit SecG [Bacilli bacterium]